MATRQSFTWQRRWGFVLSIALMWLGGVGVAVADDTPAPAARPITGVAVPELAVVDAAVEQFLDRWEIPGGAVAIAYQGRLVFARGYGWADRQAQRPVEPDARFRLASLSKPLTAVALLRLVEQGRLQLDDRVLARLDQYALPDDIDPRWHAIRLRHLLQHTGGWDRTQSFDPMFRSVEIAAAFDEPPPAGCDAIVRYMLSQPLDFAPGQRFAYSNFGYCLLGRVIERVTGQPYDQAVRQLVLEPCGAGSLCLGRTPRSEAAPGEVCYYTRRPLRTASVLSADRQRVDWPYGGFCLETMDSHGGWIGSAPDMLRFVCTIDDSRRGTWQLPAELRRQMLAPPTLSEAAPDVATHYGLGWAVRPRGGDANFWHGGSLPGTSAYLVRLAGGISWAALFNMRRDGNDDAEFRRQLDRLVADCYQLDTWPTHDLWTAADR